MDQYRIEKMKNGWFIGDFLPSVLKTNTFEVGLLTYPRGTQHPTHTHKLAIEYNLVIEGQMIIQDKLLMPGDIFVIYPYEIADPQYLLDTVVLCVKVPSIPGDKYEIDFRD